MLWVLDCSTSISRSQATNKTLSLKCLLRLKFVPLCIMKLKNLTNHRWSMLTEKKSEFLLKLKPVQRVNVPEVFNIIDSHTISKLNLEALIAPHCNDNSDKDLSESGFNMCSPFGIHVISSTATTNQGLLVHVRLFCISSTLSCYLQSICESFRSFIISKYIIAFVNFCTWLEKCQCQIAKTKWRRFLRPWSTLYGLSTAVIRTVWKWWCDRVRHKDSGQHSTAWNGKFTANDFEQFQRPFQLWWSVKWYLCIPVSFMALIILKSTALLE